LLKKREGEISNGKLPGIYFDRVPYIPMLKENYARKGFFEHAEFMALRDALPDYLKGFVTFAYKTGWRMSEITGLTWNQVDLQAQISTI
jgi:integrase